jgi:hypothetical protein
VPLSESDPDTAGAIFFCDRPVFDESPLDAPLYPGEPLTLDDGVELLTEGLPGTVFAVEVVVVPLASCKEMAVGKVVHLIVSLDFVLRARVGGVPFDAVVVAVAGCIVVVVIAAVVMVVVVAAVSAIAGTVALRIVSASSASIALIYVMYACWYCCGSVRKHSSSKSGSSSM